ncbi:hypothetical protein ACI0X9_003368 [Cronobacter turicensis]
MIHSLKLFYSQSSVSLTYLDAIHELKKAPFGVFLSFVDPRTNVLVEKLFPFFYQPHNTYGLKGRCLITEWNGIYLYIPSDLNVYIRAQQLQDRSMIEFRQGISFLSEGRFITKETSVEVSTNFRLGVMFDKSFHSLLSRSGHECCINKVAGVA